MKHNHHSTFKRPKSQRLTSLWDAQRLLDFDAPQTQIAVSQAPTAPTEHAKTESPLEQFAVQFASLLEDNPHVHFNNCSIAELAREVFGSAAGHARDAYDAAEAGFNIYLARQDLRVDSNVPLVLRLLAEQERMPLQSKRDQIQIDLQQFSTPPAQAFVVARAAALRPDMNVLEPSAGTGNIAVMARLYGAQIDTNEIDERRRSLLSLQGFQPTSFDAERLDNLLPPEKMYDAIVMNPPFSATGGRVRGHSTSFGARHIEQALLRLRPGGRLVAIVGCGMAMDRQGFLEWWQVIAARYKVRANLGMDGGCYARYGTSFDNQIIVIDNDGKTSDRASILTANSVSISKAYELLTDISKEDVYGRLCKNQQRTSVRDTNTNLQKSSTPGNQSDTGADKHSFGGWSGRSSFARGLFDDEPAMARLELLGAESDQRTRSCDTEGDGAGRNDYTVGPQEDSKLGSLAGRGNSRSVDNGVGELETVLMPQAVDIQEGTVFAAYRVQKAIVRGAHLHPANVVESTAMACVEPPDVTYRHSLPSELIIEGRVSNLQIEDVIYAGQATSVILPDGSRKGHWNGDGTGIGKGRQIYSFFYNEYQQGKQKHVHISASHQLCADAERDRSAIGLPLHIIHQAEFKQREALQERSGVLFTTYSMLATDFSGDRGRFKQLTEWLGKDFDGVIAFDEAHLMKNAAATPHGGKATVDQGTLRGNMGIALQRMFPKARVRYFSATGATEARHMAPYERLGLWGAGAPFADFPAFLVAMQRGGVAAMEMLCRDLKSVGTYLSRTISYGPTRLPDDSLDPDSAVEYEPLLHHLTDGERRQYDQIADLWSELLVAFDEAETHCGERRNGSRYSQFYSAQQRFFLQLMMAYTIPDVIPAIEKDLKEGRSVVLSLFNTGEAQTERKVRDARAEGLELSELDATPREMIVQLIEKQFPIYQYQEKTDSITGNVVRVRVEDTAGNPEINRVNQRRQQELLNKVADLDFPQNPLDAIISHFGANNVAEISGRSHRFENGKYVRRKLDGVSHRHLNEYETRLFQLGKKRLAIISGAGATGISVHADVAAKNQQRRVFYAFQLSWSADQQMQVFGRVHRSNQSSAPVIRLVLLDVAGQKRLVNAVSKRLAALGAMTKGERHSLSSDLFRPEDVTDEYGKAALCQLYRQITSGEHRAAGIGFAVLENMGVLNQDKTAVKEKYANNVELFLNRIMVLHVREQNKIFDLFYERYIEAVEAAKRQSAFDFGVEEIRAHNLRRIAEPETLFVDPASGARTMLHELEGEVDVLRHTFESADATAKLGFYRNLRSGRIYAACEHKFVDRSEISLTTVKGARRSLEPDELRQKYELVDDYEARVWWDSEYAATPVTEPRRFHLLSGAIFPIYDKVMGSSGIQSMRIARARLSNGQSLVGLSLGSEDVPNVKQRLGIGTPLIKAPPGEIIELILGGSIIELDNGWRLATARISGDTVVEVLLNGVPANREELIGYRLREEIIQYKRRWFALQEDALRVVSDLLMHRKPVKDLR